MSSPETKKVEATPSGSISTGTTSIVSGDKPNGGSGFDPGEALSSRFGFLRMVSVQGNAVFYHARDLRAGPRDALVVLKVFSGHAAGRQLELFQLEARSAAKLSHRNIIQASHPQELNGVHFCVLGHRFGAETLNTLINREGWLEPRLAIGIVHQIADALEYAHRSDVIHLRIQPGNILIDRDGTALLTDFGIEGRNDLGWAHSERSSHLPLRYASPEQAGCSPLDSRSDLYSLGVVLYQMLTDRLPVNSEDADLIRQKSIAESPLPPHLFCPNIPLSLSAAVTCLLEKDPARRFQDVAELRVALERSVTPLTDTLSPVEDAPPQEEPDEQRNEPTSGGTAMPIPVTLFEWETPSISPLNMLSGDLSISEPQFGSVEKGDELLDRLHDDGQAQSSIQRLPARGPAFESAPRQLKPLILIVALAVTVICGFIALARVDRNRASSRSVLTSSPVDTAKDASEGRSSVASPDRAEEGSRPGDRQPAAGKTPEGSEAVVAPAATAAALRTTSVRRAQTGIRKRSASTRLRQPQRKWRPLQYRRNWHLRNR